MTIAEIAALAVEEKQKNIFGKVFDDVCGCTFRIDNSTQSDLPFLKKMIELRIAEITSKTI